MKNKTILTLVTVAAFIGAFTSCKKGQSNPDSSVIKINALNSGKTITLLNGQKLELTLGNPGDGGYIFNPPQYDSSMLKLNDHVRVISNTQPNLVGNFGGDTWTFNTLKSGNTSLIITAARGSESPVIEFDGTITVR
jgi:predicted secreted protein